MRWRCLCPLCADRPMEYIFILAPDDVSLWSSERIAGSLLGGSAGLSIFVQSGELRHRLSGWTWRQEPTQPE